jgi:hypothetical protein
MLHTDIIVKAQGARVSTTHATEATSYHQNNQAIKRLTCYRRQPAPILHGVWIVVMDRLNRRRAKQSISAELHIKFAMLSSQCKAANEWETRNIGVRASTCNRHIYNKMTMRSDEV